MNSSFQPLDYIIFGIYALVILSVGLWVSRSKGKEKTTEDYFLASKSLPWWAIGASLIAAKYFRRTVYWYVWIRLCGWISYCIV
jgi:SSS family solute:Na+ symporter